MFSSILTSIISGIVIAIVSAVVTVKLSLKRFYSEKWWERKADTYATIMQSLFEMKIYCDEQIGGKMGAHALTEERTKQINILWNSGIEAIKRHRDIGSFIISKEATNKLTELTNSLDKAPYSEGPFDIVELFTKQLDAINLCMDAMRIIAKKDLNIS